MNASAHDKADHDNLSVGNGNRLSVQIYLLFTTSQTQLEPILDIWHSNYCAQTDRSEF